ncbi:hypothetical protein Ahy_A09g046323 [Arachis hypogaea]|uniref:Replication factor A C-terminal domain-containing protein n=1 Tax=Arachis hypogaea TaxID=3818 RepID=A0A445BPH2_ARAHY|nr:hypothetical protein Ahy_A09g046323 [Arachis hypogaea]
MELVSSYNLFEKPKNNISGIPNEAAFLKIYQGKIIEQLKELDTVSNKACVIDDSDCICFVVFDKKAKQVLEKNCIEILDPLLLVKRRSINTPTLLLNLIDKTFLFIVEVQISDNSHFSPSYKVKKMIDNVDLINKFKEAHPIQIVSTAISMLTTLVVCFQLQRGKVEGDKNLLLEFSNEVADNDESEVLENAITPTKRLFSESEDSKVEFQKRGLPNAHILLWLSGDRKITMTTQIDRLISSELPDPVRHPKLFKVVSTYMIHGPCGRAFSKSPCMKDGYCTKYYLKIFSRTTVIDDSGYLSYRKRDT